MAKEPFRKGPNIDEIAAAGEQLGILADYYRAKADGLGIGPKTQERFRNRAEALEQTANEGVNGARKEFTQLLRDEDPSIGL